LRLRAQDNETCFLFLSFSMLSAVPIFHIFARLTWVIKEIWIRSNRAVRFYLVLHTPLINRVLAQYAIQKIAVSISTVATNVKIEVIKFLSVGKRDDLKQEKNRLPKRHMYVCVCIYIYLNIC